MADQEDRYPENVPGPFYVDNNCIVCAQCVQTAPDNFKFAWGDKYAYVYKQPENEEEITKCSQALDSCPVNAIGSDNGIEK